MREMVSYRERLLLTRAGGSFTGLMRSIVSEGEKRRLMERVDFEGVDRDVILFFNDLDRITEQIETRKASIDFAAVASLLGGFVANLSEGNPASPYAFVNDAEYQRYQDLRELRQKENVAVMDDLAVQATEGARIRIEQLQDYLAQYQATLYRTLKRRYGETGEKMFGHLGRLNAGKLKEEFEAFYRNSTGFKNKDHAHPSFLKQKHAEQGFPEDAVHFGLIAGPAAGAATTLLSEALRDGLVIGQVTHVHTNSLLDADRIPTCAIVLMKADDAPPGNLALKIDHGAFVDDRVTGTAFRTREDLDNQNLLNSIVTLNDHQGVTLHAHSYLLTPPGWELNPERAVARAALQRDMFPCLFDGQESAEWQPLSQLALWIVTVRQYDDDWWPVELRTLPADWQQQAEALAVEALLQGDPRLHEIADHKAIRELFAAYQSVDTYQAGWVKSQNFLDTLWLQSLVFSRADDSRLIRSIILSKGELRPNYGIDQIAVKALLYRGDERESVAVGERGKVIGTPPAPTGPVSPFLAGEQPLCYLEEKMLLGTASLFDLLPAPFYYAPEYEISFKEIPPRSDDRQKLYGLEFTYPVETKSESSTYAFTYWIDPETNLIAEFDNTLKSEKKFSIRPQGRITTMTTNQRKHDAVVNQDIDPDVFDIRKERRAARAALKRLISHLPKQGTK